MKNLKLLVYALALLTMIGTGAVSAAELKTDPRSVNLTNKDEHQDLYVASDQITIENGVRGDLAAAGGSLLLNGPVENSLFAAGGTVTVRSNVTRHARLVGGNITYSGQTGGDLLVGAGEFVLATDAVVNGDLLVWGGDVEILGTVKGETRVWADTVRLNGNFSTVFLEAERVSLGSAAKVNGDLNYRSSRQASIDADASISGQTNYTYRRSPYSQFGTPFASLTFLMMLIGTFLLLSTVYLLFPRATAKIANVSDANDALKKVGYGFLALFASPLVVLALAITFVGLPLALFGLLIWVVLLVVGWLIGQLILGQALYRFFTKEKSSPLDYRIILIGVLSMAILNSVPIVGQLIGFLLFLAGIGAVANYLLAIRKSAAS